MLKKTALHIRDRVRRRYLEAGEAGWGKPVQRPPRLTGLSRGKAHRVAVIGAGGQGLAQCRGMMAVKGIEIAALVDINSETLNRTADALGLPAKARYTDAEQMLSAAGPLDLVSVATTAQSHVKLGRLALRYGAKRILLEKPIDRSLREAQDFSRECAAANVLLAVNYSRRWMLDYQAIKRCLENGAIGSPRSMSVMVGAAELAMHGSHYFDLCCYLMESEPRWVISQLDPMTRLNLRGSSFQDPSGFCLFGLQNGARAFVDLSADLVSKDTFVTIKGTQGRITVDEQRMFWTLQSRSQRVWSFPFVEPVKSAILFSRVVADLLCRTSVTDGANGIAALEMILGAHLSHNRGFQPVQFPMSQEASETVSVKFA